MGPHHAQVFVRSQPEDAEDVVEHLLVLAGGTDQRPEGCRMALQLHDHWSQLDRLWPGPEDHEHLRRLAR